MSYALNYVRDNRLGLARSYPYNGEDNDCNNRPRRRGKRISYKRYSSISPVNVQGLIIALNKQVVSVAFETQNSFQLYEKGIYFNTDCGDRLNHAMSIVGYDLTAPVPYFIVRNSWGTTWGMNGYAYVAIGSGAGTCGIASTYNVIPSI